MHLANERRDPDRLASPWRAANRRRWFRAVAQTLRDLYRSNGLEWAAAVSFYAFASAFPLMLVAMIAASWVVDASWAAGKATALMGAYLPYGEAEIEDIVTWAVDARGRAGLISLLIFVFSARRVLGALTKALNLVSDVDEHTDPLERRIAVEVALVTGLAAALLLAFASRPLLQAAWSVLEAVPGPDQRLFDAVQFLVRGLLLLVVFTLVYTVVPQGKRYWRAAFAGAVVATALFLVAQGVFTLLLDSLWTNLMLVYGPLALAALLLVWGWYIALVTLIGGALSSHVKVMIVEGRPAAEAAEVHAG